MIEQNLVVGPFQCNCKILVCPNTGEAALVDAGDEAPRIIKKIQETKMPSGLPIQIKYILQTHGHLDHVGGSREVKEAFSSSPKIALHRGDEELYKNLKFQGSMFGIKYENPLPIDHYFEDGQTLNVGELKFSILHTPGHSPGSVCLRLHQDSQLKIPETLYSGDTLFQGSVGRTDLWGGNQSLMFKSIHQRILVLDGDTRVCPGHGANTSIGVEKTENPFLQTRMM